MTVPDYVRHGLADSPETAIEDVPVTGVLPEWLEGSLLRNGPGSFQVGEQRYRHWFDGLAMLHRFTFAGGKVSYANRFLETRAYAAARDEGRIAYSEFATDPCRSLFARAMAVFDPQVTDSAKVNIARIADRFLALAETPIQVRFDPETLETVGVTRWDRSDFGRMTTVHPQIDDSRQEAINLVTRFGASSTYVLRHVDTSDPDHPRARDLATKRVGEPSYIHSFGMSERYLIVVEYPLVVNPLSLLLWLKPYIENFRWKPELGARFHVFDRETGARVRSVTTEAFFGFHHVNAFDDGGDVVVDIVGYDDASVIEAFYLHRLEEPDSSIPAGTLRRFRVPLVDSGDSPVEVETLSETPIELPSLDYARMNTRPDHHCVYGVSLTGERGFYDQLVKIDTRSRETSMWKEGGCYPGEGVFVGRPGRDAEDDGVVLSVVLEGARGTSFLLVLDAQTFTEVARAQLPHPVLLGYHGQFFGDVGTSAASVPPDQV
ncbi:carotenoid oxygenase family protein [uncultured Demequina sp.]|uniref:carotenoid oxygenase family protein n=1 Tax=uncultured Demequina sp. TaxID=693499 RepID=UPI0025EE3721|nr:carotenoid oxygenase family protein [uncultured Demequina sp.]